MTPDLRRQLAHHFRQQQRFADGYSPLYARLFGSVAGWLAGDEDNPLAEWLVAATAGREPFDVTLLLAAAVHREVLAGNAPELARFYPTARGGGDVSAEEDDEFPAALAAFILTHRERLARFIQRANVQTNETGRGLAWLLPVACLGWPAVHLVELGASAGLNLVAERRTYRVADAADPARTLLQLGEGKPQFTALAAGAAEIPPPACCPRILSRTGGDVVPFHLNTAEGELTLAAFVWGDQAQRMERLREGIAALRAVEHSDAPVRLRPMRLPEGLPHFLANDLPRPLGAPVVLFNTTVTMYLADRGVSHRGMIAGWAAAQSVPVLWLQWEPWPNGPPPPGREWLAWTADFWPNDGRGTAEQFHLAWVHPHGTALEWAAGWAKFLRKTEQS